MRRSWAAVICVEFVGLMGGLVVVVGAAAPVVVVVVLSLQVGAACVEVDARSEYTRAKEMEVGKIMIVDR